MTDLTGWLLDLYASPAGGVVLWLLGEDGQRHRLTQPLPVTFYAAGESPRLRALWKFLSALPQPPHLARSQGRDLFVAQPLPVLAVGCPHPAAQADLFRRVALMFPDLTYYNADVPLALRHAAGFGTFPLARLRVEASPAGLVRAIEPLETPWLLDPPPVPLRIMELEPDCDPQHAAPRRLRVHCGRVDAWLALEPRRALLVNLRALLQRCDPDLLLTDWGDTWLLPQLLAWSEAAGIPLPLNREPGRSPARRAGRSYFSYGQIVYRGPQVTLFGRWHIDRRNAVLWEDYGLEGTLEAARVTRLPVQTAARSSPGTGISSMQVVQALQSGILVPWHKQQVEQPKTALDLLHGDMGGLVYQPTVGLHFSVGEIDFVSMYPSLMVHGNISPETTPHDPHERGTEPPGLIPQTLGPLLAKRIVLKQRLAGLPHWHPLRSPDKARSSAHKWLLVTCFGYLGYKNARFGRIESHEAVTAGGREALLRAKEVAEDMGFEILHLYVDGLWVRKPGAEQPQDFTPLLSEINERTGLTIALDGIFRWVAFLPSRVDPRLPVPNRYFGVFQDGTLKMRGIEARRRDSAPFISRVQTELLQCLAQAENMPQLNQALVQAIRLLQRRLADLRSGRVAPHELLLAQKLSRKLAEYRSPSPAARAAQQLEQVGTSMRPGQRVRFLVLHGGQVQAWDTSASLPGGVHISVEYYQELLLRAAETVFQPFGVDSVTVRAWARGLPAATLLPMQTNPRYVPPQVPPALRLEYASVASPRPAANFGAERRTSDQKLVEYTYAPLMYA